MNLWRWWNEHRQCSSDEVELFIGRVGVHATCGAVIAIGIIIDVHIYGYSRGRRDRDVHQISGKDDDHRCGGVVILENDEGGEHLLANGDNGARVV